MKSLLLLLLALSISSLFGAETELLLSDATAIATTQVKKDNLPTEGMWLKFIDLPKANHKFYSVSFNLPIPDPSTKEENTFIGYIVEMDGTIKRTTRKITITRVPLRLPTYLHTPYILYSSTNFGPNEFLKEPFRLKLN